MVVSATQAFIHTVNNQEKVFGILARVSGMDAEALKDMTLGQLKAVAAKTAMGDQIELTALERGEAGASEVSLHMTRRMFDYLRSPLSRTEMLVNLPARPAVPVL